mmetsp:Transcript_14433/g.43743  ORF Transcript_14433/g.43743 Transcript_14433/m.43743 type:complete len:229 (+) Transcript_14433:42-728(+)
MAARRSSVMLRAAALEHQREQQRNEVSFVSDRKKYNYAAGLERDVSATRHALRRVTQSTNRTTFAALFREVDGAIANLTRALQNLRREGEIQFEGDMLLQGRDDDAVIELRESFYREAYHVDQENCFRSVTSCFEGERRGRSYEAENEQTRAQSLRCAVCGEFAALGDRLAVRGRVYHFRCLRCAVCHAGLRANTQEYLSFDARPCCSSACLQRYDAAHLRQERRDVD